MFERRGRNRFHQHFNKYFCQFHPTEIIARNCRRNFHAVIQGGYRHLPHIGGNHKITPIKKYGYLRSAMERFSLPRRSSKDKRRTSAKIYSERLADFCAYIRMFLETLGSMHDQCKKFLDCIVHVYMLYRLLKLEKVFNAHHWCNRTNRVYTISLLQYRNQTFNIRVPQRHSDKESVKLGFRQIKGAFKLHRVFGRQYKKGIR